jgi:hypothetical protein
MIKLTVLIPAMALLTITTLSSCFYTSRESQKLFAKAKTEQFDVIIVPGIPFEEAGWSHTMKGRVYWSKYLYDQGITKNIIYSGAAVYTPYYESEIMAMYAHALGIPTEHIFTETTAEHSTENIYYSYQLAKKMGFKKVAIASDPFQTKMLSNFTRKKVSKDIVLIPFVIDTLKVLEPRMITPAIDSTQAYKPDFISITKRESFWKRMRGTLGANIDESR